MEYKSPCNEVNPKSPAMVVQKPSQLPPHLAQVPYIVISPQPSYIQLPSAHMMPCPHLRKSSNTMSPSPNYYFATPNVTPISPVPLMMQSQMFFPPDFSANQFYTTNANPNVLNSSNDFLNARINQNNIMFYILLHIIFITPTLNFPFIDSVLSTQYSNID
ncbi:hypothetical protein NQ317_017122 [Molorchus minor]|uniref:Uncharacterized protein n=1 Tax=Molorchus minor TaxID=1323400 RepID=A0ABQ9JHV9_9CUCU|nr:hypothetical protein NQ317_017122 [Molorchus minor]